MNREEFDVLIRRREEESRAHPRVFLIRTAVLAASGYLYLLGVLALMGGLVAGGIALAVAAPNGATIKLALFLALSLGTVSWAILRALWIRLPAPLGRELTAAEAPELARAIAELRGQLGSPRFHRVLMVPEFNAAVVQLPRLGVFGWYRNYLLLGLPLMLAVTPDQFRAVLAHEFGHLAGGHGRFGNWLYRLRRTWERTFEEIMRRRPGRAAAPLTWFIQRFWPAFNARAFVLGRANEYEADAVAARLVGAEHLAAGLVRINLGSVTLDDDFWPGIQRLAGEEPIPPADVYVRLASAVAEFSGPDAERRLQGCLRVPTGNADTHPSLADRLRALGFEPNVATANRVELPGALGMEETAAFQLLGPALPRLLEELNSEWARNVATPWRERREEMEQIRAGLAGESETAEPPSVGQLWERALKLIRLGDHAAAESILGAVLAAEPAHAGANFLRGRRLIERDDAAGVDHLERAMAADPDAVPEACNLLYGFYSRIGRKDLLRPLEHRVDAHREEQEAGLAERQQFRKEDTFLPHALTEEQLAAVREVLAGEAEVGWADLVRKAVQHLPRSPCYVMAVRRKVPWWRPRSSSADTKLLHRLLEKLPLPGHTFVFVPEGNYKALGRVVAAVAGARVFERGR